MLEQQAFDTIDQLRCATSLTEIKTVFGAAVDSFGANAFIICDIPPGSPAGSKEIHASGWHPEWEQRYLHERYSADDPIPNSVGVKSNPFYWQEAEQEYVKNDRAIKIMNEARSEFQMLGGYCVPIHGLRGIAGLVSVATDFKDWRLSEREDAALHIVSLYAYEAVRKLRSPHNFGDGGPKLSRREVDCLQWIAEGKTTWEIGTILGISAHTVGEYISDAARKMGTHSRAHLVARALRHNIIR